MITIEQLNQITKKFDNNTKTNLEEDGYHLICLRINDKPCYSFWDIKANLPKAWYLNGNKCLITLLKRGFNQDSALQYMLKALNDTSTGGKKFGELVKSCQFNIDTIMNTTFLNKFISNSFSK